MNRESKIAEKIVNKVADSDWRMRITNSSNYTTLEIWNNLDKVPSMKLEDYIRYLEGRMYVFKFMASKLVQLLKEKRILSSHVDRVSDQITYETLYISFIVQVNRVLTKEEEVEIRKIMNIRG